MLTEGETGLPTTTLAGQPINTQVSYAPISVDRNGGYATPPKKEARLSEFIPLFIQSVLFILYYLSPSPKPWLTEDVTSLQVNMTLIWTAALRKALKGIVQFHWPTSFSQLCKDNTLALWPATGKSSNTFQSQTRFPLKHAPPPLLTLLLNRLPLKRLLYCWSCSQCQLSRLSHCAHCWTHERHGARQEAGRRLQE